MTMSKTKGHVRPCSMILKHFLLQMKDEGMKKFVTIVILKIKRQLPSPISASFCVLNAHPNAIVVLPECLNCSLLSALLSTVVHLFACLTECYCTVFDDSNKRHDGRNGNFFAHSTLLHSFFFLQHELPVRFLLSSSSYMLQSTSGLE